MNHLKPEEKWILLSIPLLFLIGALFHFLYQLSGNNPLVGLIAPINESVWEHNKMVLLPPILLWTFFYLWKGTTYAIDKDKWFFSTFISVLTMIISIPVLYYFYTEAFGVHLLWVDILLLLIANLLGQLLALHFYRHGTPPPFSISVFLLLLLIILFGWFTYHPPGFPIFSVPS